MAGNRQKINIFEYLDHRTYLKDWFAAARRERQGMSYRVFSERAGLKSWNYVMLVMQGKRNVTEQTIRKLCRGLDLNKQEGEFFRNLVMFNQAKSPVEKDEFYGGMLQSRKFNELQPVQAHQYEYCSAWYHAVIRELVTARGFDGTPEWLVERLGGRISASQAQHSLKLLEELDLIERTRRGRWKQKHSLVTAGTDIDSVALFKYHMNMLDLSRTMLEQLPGDRRDMSSLTLGIKRKRLDELNKKIEQFRRDIMKLVVLDETPEEVVQLNIYMFPVTGPATGNNKV